MGAAGGRISLKGQSKDGYRAMAGLTRAGHPDHVLSEIVKLRASRINNCAYCIENHTVAAQKAGVGDDRIAATADWAASPLFDERERAALALTDLLTVTETLSRAEGPDAAAAWEAAAVHFPDEELTQLVLTIAGINTWNRVMIAEEVSEAG
jgi:AhpD family alkylhydroperoxidase